MIAINELILLPIYLIVIFGLAKLIKSNNIIKYPEYSYFVKGLWFKFSELLLLYLSTCYTMVEVTLLLIFKEPKL